MTNYVTIYEEYKHKFYQLPKVFFTNEKYLNMSNNAKIAWALLRDRSSLSKRNKWFDEGTGRIYFIYTNKDLMKILNIKSETTITNIRKELRKVDLIEEKTLGFNQPKKIYLIYPEVTENDIYEIDNIENYTYEEPDAKDDESHAGQGLLKNGTPKNGTPEPQKMTPNNTDSSDTSSIDTIDTIDTKDHNLKNIHIIHSSISKEDKQKQKDNLKIHERQEVQFSCPCSKERLSAAIQGLGNEEIDSMIREDHGATASCHFCNEQYTFTIDELRALKS